jgi:hypothetical protein
MNPRTRLPLLVCISYVESVPSPPVLILMLLLTRQPLSAALLRTWDIAKKGRNAAGDIYASALTTPAALAVDSNTVRCLMLTAPVR